MLNVKAHLESRGTLIKHYNHDHPHNHHIQTHPHDHNDHQNDHYEYEGFHLKSRGRKRYFDILLLTFTPLLLAASNNMGKTGSLGGP